MNGDTDQITRWQAMHIPIWLTNMRVKLELLYMLNKITRLKFTLIDAMLNLLYLQFYIQR